MTLEGIHNYLGARLPLQLNARQHFRLFRSLFVLVFLSTVIIHVLMQQDQSLWGLITHAAEISLLYGFGVGLATALLHALRDTTNELRVWHLWLASMTGFVLGYYFLPLDDLMAWLPGTGTGNHTPVMGFWQLLPVWFLATYLLVQPYLSEGLKSELVRLRDINAALQSRTLNSDLTCQQLISFESGRTRFRLDAGSIRNVVVEDHYCYVHYREGDGYAKRDLAMPLRDVQALLPAGFVQVHRSHIVNPAHIASIRRKDRSIRVILDSGYEVPVSRHRLDRVLPVLRQHTASINPDATPGIEPGQ